MLKHKILFFLTLERLIEWSNSDFFSFQRPFTRLRKLALCLMKITNKTLLITNLQQKALKLNEFAINFEIDSLQVLEITLF